MTLTPEAAEPGDIARTVDAGQAVTIGTPACPRNLRTVRVPVQVTPDRYPICDRAAVGRHAGPPVPGAGRRDGAADHQPRRARPAPGDARSGPAGHRRSSNASAMTRAAARWSSTYDALAVDRRRQPRRNPPLHRHRAGGRHRRRASAPRSTAPPTRSRSTSRSGSAARLTRRVIAHSSVSEGDHR